MGGGRLLAAPIFIFVSVHYRLAGQTRNWVGESGERENLGSCKIYIFFIFICIFGHCACVCAHACAHAPGSHSDF